ncbi:salt stress-induced protein-like isoform X2 [Ananas comosus]|uniref:Salt stress-induced protein-like isoform X1 n=1 Tax=Ananas comosus TaxID=4615 RepID=A0A6P5FQ18_ANACO|nr:salt stress-induced protein-like isoform X1 [Ananas comosus]XP_020095609.1 salt stress-induced protein-like isoform X2 [Ananas comosus]
MGVVKEGPWGGDKEGKPFDTKTVGWILGFEVWYDDYITGIRFNYKQDGFEIWTPVYGSQSGGSREKVQISNRLTGIRVTVDSKDNLTVVRSLTLVAGPLISYGPYGSSGAGKSFSANGTNIVGFFGSSAELINAIGIYINT